MAEEEQKRSDEVAFKLPGGIHISASGPFVAMIVTVLVVGLTLAWSLYTHEAQSAQDRLEIKTQLVKQNVRTDDLICVLTLTQEERIEARRGADLTRYCQFLKPR